MRGLVIVWLPSLAVWASIFFILWLVFGGPSDMDTCLEQYSHNTCWGLGIR